MAKQDDKTNDALEQRVVKFAEQVGRMVGTVQAKAEGWLDGAALQSQLKGMRDEASELLEQIAAKAPAVFGKKMARRSKSSARKAKGARATAADAKSRSGGVVDGPGKRHRKPAPSTPGIKHSDERIAKLRAANTLPRRPRG